ncbi:ImmA/IrrE family metallo-endopeptidase [Microbacterium sp. QXD-8]|uniref:ImmA/IrrE family metallo-endopeptidase n=1 Tax=Microbacterium psychrotolerans TaxID=3068321 RepID=A0ABU0Z0I9_9MICO|nr:ImmA/IrrE family metallo-endopeptidase [Microbacterium sp. QXD-8]MDQ7877316.1 ImmA/IrrE family metallo-endopeptidase [Microbacterium sp. QXD-8]
MKDLLTLAAELGLTVVERRGKHLGGYHAGSRTVRLDPHMPRRVARAVLAHEIAHHVFGDEPSPYGPVRAKQERRANEWAALRLITPDAFADAERLRNGHTASMAHDLDVTPELIDAYRQVLLRIGDTTYVEPRMGAGQYRSAHA